MNGIGRLLALAIVLGAVTACTAKANGGQPTATASSTPAATASSPTAVVSVSAPPGAAAYLYQNAGLTATLELRGTTGTLQIQNRTGRELGAPSFYLLDARDGRRVEGRVQDGTPTPNDETTRFRVAFAGLQTWNIGLAVLVIGHDNVGAFVKQ